MAVVIKTVGSGGGRDYSTITAAEADISDTTYPSAGTDVVFELYDDSDFEDESVVVSWSASNVDSLTIRPAAGHGHNGVAGGGVVLVWTSSSDYGFSVGAGGAELEDLEIDGNDNIYRGVTIGGAAPSHLMSRRLLVHNLSTAVEDCYGLVSADHCRWKNCCVYNLITTDSGGDNCVGIARIVQRTVKACNCTIYNVVNNNGDGDCFGINLATDDAGHEIINCIVGEVSGTVSGTIADYNHDGDSNTVQSNNIASDTSAYGSGSQDSIDPDDLFVSTTPGSEDFRLVAECAAVIAGTPLGITDENHIDISGYNRLAAGSNWDVGAYQYHQSARHHYPIKPKRTFIRW